jgi:hypothetical protein
LGRKLLWEEWEKHKEQDADSKNPNYLSHREPLTAIGYGEPCFAAFYPNSLSVFGFHDEIVPGRLPGVTYEVIGWYSDSRRDALHFIIERARRGDAQRDWPDILKEEAEWAVAGTDGAPAGPAAEAPERIVCYASLTVAENLGAGAFTNRQTSTEHVWPIALGNTSIEALAAYVAHALGADKSSLMDQLEAIHLAPQLEGGDLDLGWRFRQERHASRFTAVASGIHWTIRPEATAPAPAPVNAEEPSDETGSTLPDQLARELNDLNVKQKAHDRRAQEIESLRQRLFSDWYKYMLLSYVPEGTRDELPNVDPDEAKSFIETHDLEPLLRMLEAHQGSRWQLDARLKEIGRMVAELQLLRPEDITDWPRFLFALRNPDRTGDHTLVLDQLRPVIEPLLAGIADLPPLGVLHWSAAQFALEAARLEEQKQTIITYLNEFFVVPALAPDRFRVQDAFKTLRTRLAARNPPSTLPVEAQALLRLLDPANSDQWRYDQLLRLGRLLWEAAFPGVIRKSVPHVLGPIPGPRYWRPNEPVVLLEPDPSIKATRRHGEDGRLRDDGLLDCQLVGVPGSAVDDAFLKAVSSEIAKWKRARPDVERIDFSTWTAQPWHPFLLEWQVQVHPLKGSNADPRKDAYPANFIVDNYELRETAEDLWCHHEQKIRKVGLTYTGRGILSPHAKVQLAGEIEAFLVKRYHDKLMKESPEIGSRSTKEVFEGHRDKILAWAKEELADIVRAYERISSDDFYCLTQALNGFNEALLMRKQTLQLPIADPLGFPDEQLFSDVVAGAVRDGNRSAPQPENYFNAIRSGQLESVELRLVDTFGRVQTIQAKQEQLIASEDMTSHLLNRAMLPARLAQPARLDFRWLAAETEAIGAHGAPEMSSHPATGPVCGWLVANHLDGTLEIFDQAGRALGSIGRDPDGTGLRWSPAPARTPIQAWQIPNLHLNNLVAHLLSRENQFLQDFLVGIEGALENIDPEEHAQHQSLALLMSRPVAVVRASLSLEVRGLPAINQHWYAFQHDLERARAQAPDQPLVRETDRFEDVLFPIRIGEYRQLNDGLVGYWIEMPRDGGSYGYEPEFYLNDSIPAEVKSQAKLAAKGLSATEGSIKRQTVLDTLKKGEEVWNELIRDGVIEPRLLASREFIKYYSDKPHNVLQSIAARPHTLTMLVDPRGAVHATSGILPAKAIRIPVEHFAEALRALEITFFSAPILTDLQHIDLPLPAEPDVTWSWLARSRTGAWQEIDEIVAASPAATFTGQQIIREGWLKLKMKNG